MRINIDWGKVVFWVFVLLTITLACLSCNPVKRVLKDSAKMQRVFDKGVELGWCVNDSIFTSDTTVLLDTLHVIETSTDTMRIGDTIYIARIEHKTITKTVTIRDTTVITDRSKEKLLQQEVSKHLDTQIKLKQDIVNIEEKEKQARKERNKWRLWFFIVLGIIGVYLFRKPLRFAINKISPIKI